MHMILRRPKGSSDMDWTVYAYGDDRKLRSDLAYLRANVEETVFMLVRSTV